MRIIAGVTGKEGNGWSLEPVGTNRTWSGKGLVINNGFYWLDGQPIIGIHNHGTVFVALDNQRRRVGYFDTLTITS